MALGLASSQEEQWYVVCAYLRLHCSNFILVLIFYSGSAKQGSFYCLKFALVAVNMHKQYMHYSKVVVVVVV